jgi:hypothetical protein
MCELDMAWLIFVYRYGLEGGLFHDATAVCGEIISVVLRNEQADPEIRYYGEIGADHKYAQKQRHESHRRQG